MATKRFSFSELAELDGGRIRAAVDQAIARMLADCKDRPGVIDARTCALTICMTPCQGEDLITLDDVLMDFHIVEKTPKRKSKSYTMKAKSNGLYFNEMSPDQPNQLTLDQIGAEDEEVA